MRVVVSNKSQGWLFVAGAMLAAPVWAQAPDSNLSCFRCHSMATMARRAPTGEVQSLAVLPERYSHSEHARLRCVACHTHGFTVYPHKIGAQRVFEGKDDISQRFKQGSNYQKNPQLFSCFNCHTQPSSAHLRVGPRPKAGMSLLPRADYAQIAEEFQRSVHYRKHPDLFSCFSCHDPHSFKRWGEVTRQSIAEQNQVCLKCHASQENYSRIARRSVPNLSIVHSWLPHQEVHMRQVRCLDCHSSYEPPVKSHAILPKSEAVRDCVKCHSGNSVLRQKLYRHRRSQEAARLGFANALIVNDAYVIGATRNRALDLFGVAILGGTVLGVGGHLMVRRVMTAKRGNTDEV